VKFFFIFSNTQKAISKMEICIDLAERLHMNVSRLYLMENVFGFLYIRIGGIDLLFRRKKCHADL